MNLRWWRCDLWWEPMFGTPECYTGPIFRHWWALDKILLHCHAKNQLETSSHCTPFLGGAGEICFVRIQETLSEIPTVMSLVLLSGCFQGLIITNQWALTEWFITKWHLPPCTSGTNIGLCVHSHYPQRLDAFADLMLRRTRTPWRHKADNHKRSASTPPCTLVAARAMRNGCAVPRISFSLRIHLRIIDYYFLHTSAKQQGRFGYLIHII